MGRKIDGRPGRRAVGVAGAAIAGAVVGLGGLASACTIAMPVFATSPLAGPPGSTVTINGETIANHAYRGTAAISADSRKLSIHWNGADGPEIAQVSGDIDGDFSIDLILPANATPGIHTLVAVSPDVGAVARAPFEITSPTAAPGQLGLAAGMETSRDSGSFSLSNDRPSSDSSSPGLLIGVGLLTAGVIALSGGFALAALRRRRVQANIR